MGAAVGAAVGAALVHHDVPVLRARGLVRARGGDALLRSPGAHGRRGRGEALDDARQRRCQGAKARAGRPPGHWY